MIRALGAEFRKLKRSRMLLWTALVVVGYTSIGLATFPVIEDLMAAPPAASPGATAAMGSAGDVFAQAGIVRIDWQTAMKFIPMGVSGAWGVMLLSLVAAYVFGRELREGTESTWATLPVRREYFVVAKLAVIAAWAAGLALLAVVADVAVVAIYLGFDSFAWSHVWRAVGETLFASFLLYLTLPLVGWLSLTRKGYLRPMLFAVVMFVVSMSLVGLDAAAYFPWSMPIAAVGVTWMPLRGELTAVSWAIALSLFAIGVVAVMRRANRVGNLA